MRFLANENFPIASVRRLLSAGHDVVAILEVSPGARDLEVLAQASSDGRIILTFDRDYGELIYRRRLPVPPGLLYLRFAPVAPVEPAEAVLAILRAGIPLEGRFTIADRNRVRQRPLP